MRTYTTMQTGSAAKLLLTHHGQTTTVATVPTPEMGTAIAQHLNGISANLLIEATDPDLPTAVCTLGVRHAQVQPDTGTLLLSPLARRTGPDEGPNAAWRSTGFATVANLGHLLGTLEQLPAGPARSIRHELADLLAEADGPVITATITADDDYARERPLRLSVTRWFTDADDDTIAAVIGDDFAGGYGTDEIAYAYEDHAAPLMRDGFSVNVDAGAATAWIREHRPHLLT